VLTRKIMFDIPAKEYRELFDWYTDTYLYKGKYSDPRVVWLDRLGSINVIVVRNNELYVTNDMKRNNDFLVVIENKLETYTKYVFECTADPKMRKDNIANLLSQSYVGNIRNHKWIFGRICIAQDNSNIWVGRFTRGIKDYKEYRGKFGINIHDNGGFFNSSLGCVVLAKQTDFYEEFSPLLKRVKAIAEFRDFIPVIVIGYKLFENHLDIK